MNNFFTRERFPDCKSNLFIQTPCAPVQKLTGSIKFEESTLFFANNDLGNGAMITILLDVDDETRAKLHVWINWVDWNEFEYESVGF